MFSCRTGSDLVQTAVKRMLSCCGSFVLLFLAVAGFGLLPRMQAAEDAFPSPQINAGLVTLRGNTRPEAVAKNDRGRVSDGLTLNHMMLQLQRTPEQEQAFQQFIEDLHDPTSPLFHHWITAAEFGQKYGAAPADVAKVTGLLESHRFKVEYLEADWNTFRSTFGLASAYPQDRPARVHPPSSPTDNLTHFVVSLE